VKSAVLFREPSTDDGTFGVMTLDTGESFNALELPWRNNDNGLSCIPCGTYIFKWFNSPKHGWCYEAQNVPVRSHIQIHSANFAGDVKKGKKSELLGCIALGTSVGMMRGQNAVLGSVAAMKRFHALTKAEPIEIIITNDELGRK